MNEQEAALLGIASACGVFAVIALGRMIHVLAGLYLPRGRKRLSAETP